jgi:TolA-binding protein
MNDKSQKTIAVIAVIIIFAILGGLSCAYFNTFYNARKKFGEAEKENREAIETHNRPQTQKYNSAIESAGRLLQDYPDSKWADDALLLMGKSYYRIQQYSRAERKFEELFANHPNSPLIPEGKYWLALTKKETGNVDEAKNQLRALLGMEIPRELSTKVRFSLANILFEEESYDKARVEYEKIVEKSKENRDRADAQFHIAECYSLAGKDSSAAQAYLKVLNYSPYRDLEFEAQFNYGNAQKELGHYDQVKAIFEDLLSKDIYFSYFPRVELELADLLYRTGNADEAKAKYQRLIELNPRTQISARAYFELGMISMKHDRDLDKAKENFAKVRSESAQSKYVPLAESEIESLDKYHEILNRRGQVATQIVTLEDVLANLRGISETSDSTQEKTPEAEGDSTQIKGQIKDLYLQLDAFDYRLSEYYRYDLADLDSTLSVLHFLVRPGVSDTVRAKALISMAEISRDSLDDKASADSFYQVLITAYKGTDYENIGRKALGMPEILTEQDSITQEYNLADSLLWVVGDTLQSLGLFRQLAKGDTSDILTMQAQYTVGWIYEHLLGEKDSAEVAYRELTDRFPSSDLAQSIKKRIEAVVVEPGVNDSLSNLAPVDSTAVKPGKQGEQGPETSPEIPLETKRRIIKR